MSNLQKLLFAAAAIVALGATAYGTRTAYDATYVQGSQAVGQRLLANPVPIAVVNSDGGIVAMSGGGRGNMTTHEIPPAFSDQCLTLQVPANGAPDGGAYSIDVVAGQWYDLTIKADNSGAFVGCWANNARINADMNDAGLGVCFPWPALKDGTQRTVAWPASLAGVDAGALNGKARIWFFSDTTGGLLAKACPITSP